MIGLKRAGIWAAWFAAAFLAFGPSIGSRNGSGTFTTPNTFVAGTTITAAAFNQNFSDIASELTNSVAADGQTSMTGPLKLSNGTTGLPSMTFASDQNTGIYRSASDELSVSAGGTQIAAFSSAGIDAKVGRLLEGGQALVPPGVMFDYGGINAPTGYLLCDGSAVSRTTYVDLFNVIGTFYGSGNGTTTFNVPDFRGRVGAGRDDMGGSAANRITSTLTDHGTITGTSLGSTGGSETHAQSLAE